MTNKYRSGSERNAGNLLDRLAVPFNFEPYYINYTWLEYKKYLPDFVLPNGIVLEVKGRFTLEDRKKHLFLKESHPKLDIRFVFDNPNNKLSKGGKSTYADWCNRNGFVFCSAKTLQDVIEAWAAERNDGREGPEQPVPIGNRRSSRKTGNTRKGAVSKRASPSTAGRNKAGNKHRARRRKGS